jgi:hypothetical protein
MRGIFTLLFIPSVLAGYHGRHYGDVHIRQDDGDIPVLLPGEGIPLTELPVGSTTVPAGATIITLNGASATVGLFPSELASAY